MIARDTLRTAIAAALDQLGFAKNNIPIVLERPREAAHGDMSSPIAMALARELRKNPFEIAGGIVAAMEPLPGEIASAEVIKPGFINFRFAESILRGELLAVLEAGNNYGSSTIGGGKRWLVEYVSANPTGPLVIVSARAAAVGYAIVNLLKFAGFDTEGEYYVNDYGGQVAALEESFRYRLRERFDLLDPGEEIGAYPGSYLKEIADRAPEDSARKLLEGGEPGPGRYAIETILSGINEDLGVFGVEFDNQFLESTLHPDAVLSAYDYFVEKGATYEQDGAVFFRSTDLGDDKDRVLRKSDGAPTYFTADIAYHRDKFERGFEKAVDLLGPDHHGHVARMKAAMSVLGAGSDWLDVLIVGWVRLLEDGKPVGMSKRKGEFVTLNDLVTDVGADVAKYFFLMRRANSPLDFDLTLARKQSDENPVYYVQYAHARISSVTRFAKEQGFVIEPDNQHLDLLTAPAERELMLLLFYFQHVIEGAAVSMEPHRLTTYAQELATAFHQFYHECRIVSDDKNLTSARLLLAEATRQVLNNTLGLLGVSAPARM